jgi:predicted metal-binding membrane protein
MLVAVIVAAWLAALAVQLSGHAELLGHDALIEGSTWPLPVALLVFLLAWQLMIAGMMLPSALPMISLFSRASSIHPRPRAAMAAFVGGYALVWTVAGALAFDLDVAVHSIVDSSPWLAARPWLVAGTLLAVAGGAQFLPLTRACLRSCRSPYAYLLERYRPGVAPAFRLGRNHGLYCVGCCWGLMLVMFAVGVANVLWMAGLTAVMVYAKTGRHGHRLPRIVGTVLLAWSVAVLVHPVWLPTPLAALT